MVDGARAQAGRQAQKLALTLRPHLAHPLASARIRPVQDRAHLINLLGYLIKQPAHHTLGVHPALWEGSCLPDLLGARLLPGLQLGIWGLAPRLSVADVARRAGLETWDPCAFPELTPSRLIAAVAAVLALPNSFRAKLPDHVNARAAVCQLLAEGGCADKVSAEALQICERSVRNLLQHPVPEGLVAAIQRRLALEEAARSLATTPSSQAPAST